LEPMPLSTATRQLRCGHTFHTACTGKWVASQRAMGRVAACPICRCPVFGPVSAAASTAAAAAPVRRRLPVSSVSSGVASRFARRPTGY
jgi:hypothetical protein